MLISYEGKILIGKPNSKLMQDSPPSLLSLILVQAAYILCFFSKCLQLLLPHGVPDYPFKRRSLIAVKKKFLTGSKLSPLLLRSRCWSHSRSKQILPNKIHSSLWNIYCFWKRVRWSGWGAAAKNKTLSSACFLSGLLRLNLYQRSNSEARQYKLFVKTINQVNLLLIHKGFNWLKQTGLDSSKLMTIITRKLIESFMLTHKF